MQPSIETVGKILAQAQTRLGPFSATAALDAQVLLAHVLAKTRSWVLAHPQALLAGGQISALETALADLERGQPLPYVLGHWEFFGLDFIISPAVLIPRPETELLVERALVWYKTRAGQAGSWAVDVGTGSGCIAVTLAVYAPELQVIASDLSFEALQIARQNARRHAVAERVHFLQADLLTPFLRTGASAENPTGESPVARLFDLICANPPYITTEMLPGLSIFGKEPTLALDGGPGGLVLINRLLQQARLVLAARGRLLCEIEASQGESGRLLAQAAFPEAAVQVLIDLAGHNRVIEVQR